MISSGEKLVVYVILSLYACLSFNSRGIDSFGGTDSKYHYNDIWTYNTVSCTWTEVPCTGFIPSPREGHSAGLVHGIIYVYGGRGCDGKDLGDLAGFKITGVYPFQRRYSSPWVYQVRTD